MSGKLHVVNVFSTFAAGGMEMAMIRLASQLDYRGIKSSVVVLKGDTNGVVIPENIEIHKMNSKDNSPFLGFRLGKLFKSIEADVIHARNWGAWPDSAVGQKLCPKKNSLVFSFHGWSNQEEIPSRRKFVMKMLSGMTDHIFTVAENSRDLFASQTKISAEKISIVPNGVDTKKYYPDNNKSKSAKPFVIGTAGSLKPIKNQAELIIACSRLLDKNYNIHLKIAGQGPLYDELKKIGLDYGLEGRLELAGQVENMAEYYNSLDCFVLPSLSEAHPNALIEAMACGLPCIATDTGGVKDILDDGAAGIILEEPTADSIATALQRIKKSPPLASMIAQAARDQISKKFTLTQMADNYEKIYRELN